MTLLEWNIPIAKAQLNWAMAEANFHDRPMCIFNHWLFPKDRFVLNYLKTQKFYDNRSKK